MRSLAIDDGSLMRAARSITCISADSLVHYYHPLYCPSLLLTATYGNDLSYFLLASSSENTPNTGSATPLVLGPDWIRAHCSPHPRIISVLGYDGTRVQLSSPAIPRLCLA